jgi:Peptidase family S41
MMLLRRMILGLGAVALLALPVVARAETGTNALPDFQELRELIRSHLTGETDADLNRDAVLGLLHQLHAKVSLVPGKTAPAAISTSQGLAKSAVYDGVAYLRVAHVGTGLAGTITSALKDLGATNHLKGIVLDLRFADGHDYAAAAAVADLFFAKERPLLDWGSGMVSSTAKDNAVTLPITILVNEETAAAAEALAAALREDNRAIVLGATTAGEASMSQEYPLKDGQYLRIATSAIKLSDGETLSAVNPDIQVTVKPDDEQAYFADPYKDLGASVNFIPSIIGDAGTSTNGTNKVARARPLNEAELMRERRERPGVEVDDLPLTTPANLAEVEKPVIRDPVLGRAMDLIKGIAALHHSTKP